MVMLPLFEPQFLTPTGVIGTADPVTLAGDQESMDGGLVLTSLSSNALIKIVQVSHSENDRLLPVKVNIYTLEVGDEAS